MKRLAILGATGSVGLSTLAVVRRHPRSFRVVALSAHSSVDALQRLAAEFGVRHAAVADPDALSLRPDLADSGWRTGPEAVRDLARLPEVDVVVNAVVGAAGLGSTLAALESGKRCALANKESLVAGGELVLAAARKGGGELVPVDSEHSAILQCIAGAKREDVWRVILTASGGAFRDADPRFLERATAAAALQHPTWKMGAKITIDSATLANKALEVIEARYLYGLPYERIDVVVHPTSVVHSFVEFADGSVLAQMGEPTMELPILHALTWPERATDHTLRTFDPVKLSPLAFEPVDETRFPLFRIGVNAGRAGGTAPTVFNAANEVAVNAFLDGKVTFQGMAGVVSATLESFEGTVAHDLRSVLAVDTAARNRALEEISTLPEGFALRQHHDG